MSECSDCTRKEALISQLEDQIEQMDNAARLLEIAEEYADVLADQGRIPNTPAGKRAFI